MDALSPTGIRRKAPARNWPEEVSYCEIDHRMLFGAGLRMERGFFFGMVENGTVCASDDAGERMLRRGDLILLSPSRSCVLRGGSADFAMIRIRLEPDFFDTLPDGQAMYSQLSRRFTGARAPILHPDPAVYAHLRSTAMLFADHMAPFESCRRGIVRHWCGLFLLQVAELLHHGASETPVSVRRSDLLFRQFMQLSVEHYRTHHDIAFYADRLNISTTYLSRIVKRTTGHTVYTHLAGLLCAEARKELERSDQEVKEIADRLGFADQSSFGKFFRAQTGMSPNRYRLQVGLRHDPGA